MNSNNRMYLKRRLNKLKNKAGVDNSKNVQVEYLHACSCGNGWTAPQQESTCRRCGGIMITITEKPIIGSVS